MTENFANLIAMMLCCEFHVTLKLLGLLQCKFCAFNQIRFTLTKLCVLAFEYQRYKLQLLSKSRSFLVGKVSAARWQSVTVNYFHGYYIFRKISYVFRLQGLNWLYFSIN